MGILKLGNLMRFVSRSVVIGFVNALAILIFAAQLPELNPMTERVGTTVYIMTAAGLVIIYLFPLIPKIGRIVPSPLICIVDTSNHSSMIIVYSIRAIHLTCFGR